MRVDRSTDIAQFRRMRGHDTFVSFNRTPVPLPCIERLMPPIRMFMKGSPEMCSRSARIEHLVGATKIA